MTGLFPAFRLLKPETQLVVLFYWGALCIINLRNTSNRSRLPINTGSENKPVGLITLFRIILGAGFFAVPLLHRRGWLGIEVLVFVLCLLLFYPWWTARHIAIPLGMPRLAYALTAFTGLEWWNDKPEGPVTAAAWCLSRQRKATEHSIAWVEKQLDPARRLRASTVAAHAMLAASRGHVLEARTLFESMLLLDGRTAPDAIWRICVEWLATDAAARGDWSSVRRIARHYFAPRIATLVLLARVAQRPPGKRSASILEVWLARVPFRSLDLTPIFSDRPIPSQSQAAELKNVAERWEKVLGDERLRQHLSLRAAELGGGDADAALNQLRHEVESDVMHLIDAAIQKGETVPEDSPIVKAALSSRRRKLVAELAEKVTRMDERRRGNRALPAIDEWKEFLAAHRAYSLLCSSADRSGSGTAFYTMFTRLNVYAVWLLDQKNERAIANAIFRFLVSESDRNKSPDRELVSRNARASLHGLR